MSEIEFPPYPRDPNSIRGRAWAAAHAEHNGMLPPGVDKHPADTCRPGWCGLDPVPRGTSPLRHLLENAQAGVSAADMLGLDLALTGTAYTVDGVRVPPEDVVVHQLEDERCQGAEPAGEIHAQDDFLTRLDELLDATLHDDHCYIGPNDTRCVCILGKIRAVLPPCGAVQLHRASAHTTWRCLRTAHPSDPSAHYFSED